VIHLVNNAEVLAKIKSPDNRLALAAKAGTSDRGLVELAFLATLSRRPTKIESAIALEHIASAADRLAAFQDLQHALILSNEFLLRH
jgi:hypothetical protein